MVMGASLRRVQKKPNSKGGIEQRDSRFSQARAAVTMGLLIVSGLLGGNGSDTFDLISELVAVGLLFLVLADTGRKREMPAVPVVLVVLICALPLAQVVPIPMRWWQALPWHTIPLEIQSRTGTLGGVHCWSLDPDATRETAVRMLPGLATFLSLLGANSKERSNLVIVAIAVTLVSALLGAIQFSTAALYLFPTTHQGMAVGIFTNRNHDADMLIVGMLLVAAAGRRYANKATAAAMFSALIVLLALCVVTTTSRMGTAIMIAALIASLALLFGREGRFGKLWLGLALLLAMAGLLAFSGNAVVHHTLERYAQSDVDGRYNFWINTKVATQRFWPFGSGFGTFVPVYATVEDLDNVGNFYVNHAHNDYLELALEGGIVALALIAATFVTILFYAARAISRPDWAQCASGLGIVAVMAIHSAVDYPLRTIALSTMFGLGCGLLIGVGDWRRLGYATL
jgi:O-antigen ligase